MSQAASPAGSAAKSPVRIMRWRDRWFTVGRRRARRSTLQVVACQVLLLAAVGHTNREIAKVFHLSEQTVHNYRANLMEKLGFHDRVELLKFAIRRGIISVADL